MIGQVVNDPHPFDNDPHPSDPFTYNNASVFSTAGVGRMGGSI